MANEEINGISEKPGSLDKNAPRYPLSVIADLLASTPQPPVILQEKSEKPIIPNDLEGAADIYASDSTGFIDMTAYRAFIAGAKWDREKMMSEAVECYYGYVNNCTKVFLPEGTLKGINEGYVKIVILKNDE